jgi:hypothetical protein
VVKHLKTALILALGVGLAYWFASRLDWQTVGAHLKGARIWPLALAAALINLTLLVRSLRWRALLKPISPVKLRNLFAATSIGFGSIFVLGRAGEIVRPAVLSLRERLQPTATFATILIERLFDTTAVVSLFAVNLLFFEPPVSRQDEISAIHTIGLLLVIGLVAGIAILVALRLKAKPILGWLEKQSKHLPRNLMQPLLNFVGHLSEGLSVLLNARALLTTLFFTACVWGLVSAATWLTLYAFGLSYPFSNVIFILGFGLVGSVVPTPGGSAGAFHAAAAKALEFLGLDPNLAASIAIVYHLIAFGPPFIVALYFLIRDDISFSQIREMIASEGAAQAPLSNEARLSSQQSS